MVMLILGEMAVQLSQERSTREDIPSAYSALLSDINECLHQCKSLETERSYREIVTDWAGHRGNIPRLTILMEELKEEVENGSNLFRKLIRKVNELKLLDVSGRSILKYTSDTMNSYAKIFADSYSLFARALVNLQEVDVIIKGKLIRSMAKYAPLGVLTCVFVLSFLVPEAKLASLVPEFRFFSLVFPGLRIAFVVNMLYCYVITRLHYSERGCKYLKLQSLFESLDNPELMGILKATHYTAENLIGQVDELMKECKAKVIECETRRKEEQLDYEFKHLERNTRSITLERNYAEDCIKATKIFYDTEREELQELAATESDMSEDCRKRIARRAAVRNCRTFLTKGLHYSNDEADELINNIQN